MDTYFEQIEEEKEDFNVKRCYQGEVNKDSLSQQWAKMNKDYTTFHSYVNCLIQLF